MGQQEYVTWEHAGTASGSGMQDIGQVQSAAESRLGVHGVTVQADLDRDMLANMCADVTSCLHENRDMSTCTTYELAQWERQIRQRHYAVKVPPRFTQRACMCMYVCTYVCMYGMAWFPVSLHHNETDCACLCLVRHVCESVCKCASAHVQSCVQSSVDAFVWRA